MLGDQWNADVARWRVAAHIGSELELHRVADLGRSSTKIELRARLPIAYPQRLACVAVSGGSLMLIVKNVDNFNKMHLYSPSTCVR